MEGIFKATSGQSKLEHMSFFFTDGRIGYGFDPHVPNTPTDNISEFSEEGQAAYVTLMKEGAMRATGQKEEEVTIELQNVVCKAIAVKEEVPCEATIGK